MPQADSFAHPPLDPVPDHSFPHGPGNGETDPAFFSRLAAQIEGGKKRASQAGSILVDLLKVRPAQQAPALGKSEPGAAPGLITGSLRSGLLFRR
jgi:hypothetical protein